MYYENEKPPYGMGILPILASMASKLGKGGASGGAAKVQYQKTPKWVTPVLAGAGVLLLVVVLTMRK